MRIYIRHATKQYDNGKSQNYSHDPGITEDAKNDTLDIAKKLISEFGIPNMIICSPYRRARETALIMNSYLESINEKKIIYCDVKISEYLGNHRNDKLDVTNETLIFNPPHPENFYQMCQRIKLHDSYMNQNYNQNNIIWIISHGLIIRELAKLYSITLSKQLQPLEYFVLSK